jgi:hypothetical protein
MDPASRPGDAICGGNQVPMLLVVETIDCMATADPIESMSQDQNRSTVFLRLH